MTTPGFTAESAIPSTAHEASSARRSGPDVHSSRAATVIPAVFTIVYCGFYSMADGRTGIACYANGVRIS